MSDAVIVFIDTFKEFDVPGDITNLFTKRYCCIFAYILYKEFPDGEVWWDIERRHCVFKQGDYYFDITGLTVFSGNGHKLRGIVM